MRQVLRARGSADAAPLWESALLRRGPHWSANGGLSLRSRKSRKAEGSFFRPWWKRAYFLFDISRWLLVSGVKSKSRKCQDLKLRICSWRCALVLQGVKRTTLFNGFLTSSERTHLQKGRGVLHPGAFRAPGVIHLSLFEGTLFRVVLTGKPGFHFDTYPCSSNAPYYLLGTSRQVRIFFEKAGRNTGMLQKIRRRRNQVAELGQPQHDQGKLLSYGTIGLWHFLEHRPKPGIPAN